MSPYLNQCWTDSLTHICGTSGRWVNAGPHFVVIQTCCKPNSREAGDSSESPWWSYDVAVWSQLVIRTNGFRNIDPFPICRVNLQENVLRQRNDTLHMISLCHFFPRHYVNIKSAHSFKKLQLLFVILVAYQSNEHTLKCLKPRVWWI